MGTSNVRLVKTSARTAPQASEIKPKQVRFTNWSQQFLSEHAAQQASRTDPRTQFENLFQTLEVQ